MHQWTNVSIPFETAHIAQVICSYNCVQAIHAKQIIQAV